MPVSKWTLVAYMGGGLFALLSALRYYVIYPDLDKAISYVLIGIMIMALGWLYNKVKQNTEMINKMDDFLADERFERNFDKTQQEDENIRIVPQ